MKATSALKEIADITASQWGFVTTAQAEKRGVDKLMLSRLAKKQLVERVVQGVYRDVGVPTSEFDEIKAYWLSAKPELLAEERIARPENDFVASGATASWLHGLGDLTPSKYEFVANVRKQTTHNSVRFRVAKVSVEDVTLAQGLPVQSPAAAVVELLRERTDLSIVEQVVSDARSRIGDMAKFSDSLKTVASDYGLGRNNGGALAAVLNDLKMPELSEIAKQSQKIEESMKVISSQVENLRLQMKMSELQSQLSKLSDSIREINVPGGRSDFRDV
ncbi:MAG: hypothetical protein RLZZ359_266 [Actinomycetota bacterium]|jgi:hypothetical protein